MLCLSLTLFRLVWYYSNINNISNYSENCLVYLQVGLLNFFLFLKNEWPCDRRRSIIYSEQCSVENQYLALQNSLWSPTIFCIFIFESAGWNCIWVAVTVVESCLLSGWSFISSLIHRPDHVSPLKESQGIDLYTCWLLLTCHSRGVAWHSLAHCCDMCSLTLCAAHLVVLNHCSFRLCIIEMDTVV